jgi:hypothetical protein
MYVKWGNQSLPTKLTSGKAVTQPRRFCRPVPHHPVRDSGPAALSLSLRNSDGDQLKRI